MAVRSNYGKCIVEAFIAKGYYFKIAIDIHAPIVPKMALYFTEQGLLSSNADANGHMAIILEIARTQMKRYRCSREQYICINTKHLQKQLKNIKKKDSLRLFIAEDSSNKLSIQIRPEVSGNPSTRFETNRVPFTPSKFIELQVPSDEQYHHSIAMESNDFLKLKKLTADNKIIKQIMLRIQADKFISFSSENPCYDSEIGCGEMDEDDDEIYEKNFRASHFNALLKMSSVVPKNQEHINFYAPRDHKYALKMSCEMGSGGQMIVYLKDVVCIKYEESAEDEQEPIKVKKKRSKKEDRN